VTAFAWMIVRLGVHVAPGADTDQAILPVLFVLFVLFVSGCPPGAFVRAGELLAVAWWPP
jgi:hypothetical protein